MSLGLVPTLLLYTILATWIIYTFLLADPSTSTMSQIFTIKLPNHIEHLLLRFCGPHAVRALRTSSQYALTVVYLTIVLGSWSIVFTYGYSWITTSSHVHSYHKTSGYLVFLLCIASYHKTRSTSPGYITPYTLPRYESTYPYDNLLFPNDRMCPTVGIPRLPRSKYDRVSQRHVARFDHYCGWVGNTIGEENYRYFLWFLLVHVGMCAYGTWLFWWLFCGEVDDMDLLNAVYIDGRTGEKVRASLWVVGNYMLRKRFAMAGVLVLMAAMTVCLGLFLGFHLFICARGMTTNEYYKWKDVKKWYWSRKRQYEKAKEEGMLELRVGDDGRREGDAGSLKRTDGLKVKDVDVGCVGPVNLPPSEDKGSTNGAASNTQTDKDQPYDPGPFPTNIYNLGIIENYKEVLFPRSLRKEALDRWAIATKERQRQNEQRNKGTEGSPNRAQTIKYEKGKTKSI